MLLPSQGRTEPHKWLRISRAPYQLGREIGSEEVLIILDEDIEVISGGRDHTGKIVWCRGWIGPNHPQREGRVVVAQKSNGLNCWIPACGNPLPGLRVLTQPHQPHQPPQPLQGPTGVQGPAGTQGATGPQGLKGDRGATGADGPQGPKGDKGETGADGQQGPKGETGATGQGATTLAFLFGGGVGIDGSSGIGISLSTNPGGATGGLSPAICGGDQGSVSVALGVGISHHLGKGFHLGGGLGPYYCVGGDHHHFGFGGGLVLAWGPTTVQKTNFEKINFGLGVGAAWHPYKPVVKEDSPHPDPPDDDPHPPLPDL